MKKLLTAFVGLLMMFALASCGGNNVATVNGEDISNDDYTEYLDNVLSIYEANGYSMENEQLLAMRDTVVQELVNTKLVEQAAEELDCYPTKDEINEYYEEQLTAMYGDVNTGDDYIGSFGLDLDFFRNSYAVSLCQEKISESLVPEATMTEEEAREIYDADPEAYNTRTVSHILVMPDAGDRETETDDEGYTIYTDEEWAAAEEKAKELIAELDNGADFAELAKENSDDTGSAENGGDLEGAFTREGSSYVEEFTNAAFELTEVGAYTEEPVRSSYGYHIIKIDDMTSEDNLDEVLQGIIDDDLASQRSDQLTAYMDEFEADAVIVYYDEEGNEIKEEDDSGDAAADDTAADDSNGETTDDAAADDSGSDSSDNANAE